MLSHQEIEELAIWFDPDLNAYMASNRLNPHDATDYLAFGGRIGAHPKLHNLLAAAPVLYMELSRQFKMLQALIDSLELSQDPNAKVAVSLLTAMQNGCLLAQRVAQVGIDEVHKTLA